MFHIICSPNLDEVIEDEQFSSWAIIKDEIDCTNDVERRIFQKDRYDMLELRGHIFNLEEISVVSHGKTELCFDNIVLEDIAVGIDNKEVYNFLKCMIPTIINYKLLFNQPLEVAFIKCVGPTGGRNSWTRYDITTVRFEIKMIEGWFWDNQQLVLFSNDYRVLIKTKK